MDEDAMVSMLLATRELMTPQLVANAAMEGESHPVWKEPDCLDNLEHVDTCYDEISGRELDPA